MAVFTIASQGLYHGKLSCKICQRNIDIAYMRSHIAEKNISLQPSKKIFRKG